MRVLQVHTAYRELGGEDVVVQQEADLLRGAGHEVIQRIAHNPTGTVPTLAALATAPWRPRAARAVAATVRSHQPDVAAVHNTWFALSPAVVAELGAQDVPVAMTLHNYRLLCPAMSLFHHGQRCLDCVGGSPWVAVRHRCYRDSAALSAIGAATVESWRRSGAIDAVSRFVVMTPSARDLFVRGGLPAERIVVRPHGLADPGGALATPSQSRTVLYVGRAVEEKGLAALLDWWGRAPRPFRLDVIGDGPVLDERRDRVPEGVTCRGALPRAAVLEAMRGARAVVVPSLWDEPFGLVAVEAMAMGVGVWSSGRGGLADIHGSDGGWVSRPGDHDAWDAVLESLDDDEVDRAGAAARDRYLERFTLDTARDSLLRMYREMLAGQ